MTNTSFYDSLFTLPDQPLNSYYVSADSLAGCTISNSVIATTTFRFASCEKTSGTLTWADGQFHFEGDADESAQHFFDYLKVYVDSYIDSELAKHGISRK